MKGMIYKKSTFYCTIYAFIDQFLLFFENLGSIYIYLTTAGKLFIASYLLYNKLIL